ncbi:hypothetical protein D4765_18425 [Subtercola vilae]|uniref:4Fe-4S Wbl-type domain-containing protein n=2 Tax=Subtercola vilae TaxID=2056433 RepID=A0A4T2BHP3_9MICO|nr:hypothetical protein D4765_18425 [Subtercola vilae]
MPEDLVEFDREITDSESEKAARKLLAVHIRAKKHHVYTLIPAGATLPCLENVVHFSSWPNPKDFSGGANSTEYGSALAIHEIEEAHDKKLCAGCPFRVECLAQALSVGAANSAGGLDDEGVFGGWGRKSRQKIGAKFDSLRRAYVRGVEGGENPMPADDIARIDAEAKEGVPWR